VLRRAKPLLGTLVEIAACAPDAAIERAACDAAFAAIADVHRLMSFHEPTSDVSRLNRAAHARPIAVDPRTAAVLRRARAIGALSGGAFDCTIGARMVALGLLPRDAAEGAADGASFRDVLVGADDRVRFRRPLAIDLGGIAKGYAVDLAVEALVRAGAEAGCVNAGGDLRVFGDRNWPVAIRHPDGSGAAVALPPLRNRALATSADSFARRGHVIDPATGHTRPRPISVSVIAPSCMDADALTKVVWLAEHPPIPLLERMHARTILVGCADPGAEPAARTLRAVG
jgi:FAD:protein FMN transferase